MWRLVIVVKLLSYAYSETIAVQVVPQNMELGSSSLRLAECFPSSSRTTAGLWCGTGVVDVEFRAAVSAHAVGIAIVVSIPGSVMLCQFFFG